MPLFERGRVEVYVPDLPLAAYHRLLETLEAEFTYTFGGCTVQRGLEGLYLSQSRQPIQDRITLIYTDTPYLFTQNLPLLSRFVDELRIRAAEALEEEAILVAVMPVYHSEWTILVFAYASSIALTTAEIRKQVAWNKKHPYRSIGKRSSTIWMR